MKNQRRRSAIPTALASTPPDSKKMLIDYAAMRIPHDLWSGASICRPTPQSDLRAAKRDYKDVVCCMPPDDDHCCGVGDKFWLDHLLKRAGKPEAVLELQNAPSIPLVRIADKAGA